MGLSDCGVAAMEVWSGQTTGTSPQKQTKAINQYAATEMSLLCTAYG